MKHVHHIIPKHMGGTDDPNNLVELTVDEHAEAHRLLYEKYGKWQDRVAWQGLLKLINHDQIMIEIWESRKGQGNAMYGKPCYYKMSEEEKQAWKDNISKATKGKPKSQDFINTMKEKMKGSNNPRFGKDPWNKGRTGLQTKSAESRAKVSKPIIYNGVKYYGIAEAARANNTTHYYIRKSCTYINE